MVADFNSHDKVSLYTVTEVQHHSYSASQEDKNDNLKNVNTNVTAR